MNINKRCILDIESESLEPTQGRIICIGVKDCGSGQITVFYDDNEERLLRSFLDYFHIKGFNEIIGYNVLFDVRFIFAKCLKYKISSNGFFKSTYTDLMGIMKSTRQMYSLNKPGTLSEWVEFLFNDFKIEKAESVPELFHHGDIQKIIDYNRKDVELTYNLWKRIQEVLS